ncbi:MAG: hypothetical protein V3T03_04695 [Candidatus Bipolaricaulota bacterium]
MWIHVELLGKETGNRSKNALTRFDSERGNPWPAPYDDEKRRLNARSTQGFVKYNRLFHGLGGVFGAVHDEKQRCLGAHVKDRTHHPCIG